jgi:hypothetical protein
LRGWRQAAGSSSLESSDGMVSDAGGDCDFAPLHKPE